MKITTLNEALTHKRLFRYAALPPNEAATLAHQDFISAQDHGFLPTESLQENYVSKMYATDFFREVVEFSPELITNQLVKDFERIFIDCNGASRLNIVQILGLLKRDDATPFLEGIMTNPEQNMRALTIVQAASEALLIIRGHLEIAENNLIIFKGRQIYWNYPRSVPSADRL